VNVRRILAVAVSTATAAAVTAGPAAAQTQSGLVNVSLSGNTVQVPIAVAANVCDLQVGVLAQGLTQGTVPCTALSSAPALSRSTGGGGGGSQQGLVNIAANNNTIQVPVGIAANICGVQAGVLASQLTQTGTAACNATATPIAGA
jgi:hypothetical protein